MNNHPQYVQNALGTSMSFVIENRKKAGLPIYGIYSAGSVQWVNTRQEEIELMTTRLKEYAR